MARMRCIVLYIFLTKPNTRNAPCECSSSLSLDARQSPQIWHVNLEAQAGLHAAMPSHAQNPFTAICWIYLCLQAILRHAIHFFCEGWSVVLYTKKEWSELCEFVQINMYLNCWNVSILCQIHVGLPDTIYFKFQFIDGLKRNSIYRIIVSINNWLIKN